MVRFILASWRSASLRQSREPWPPRLFSAISVSTLPVVVNGGRPQLAKREMTATSTRATRTVQPVMRSVAVVAALGAFLTFTNPFSATGSLPYWGGFFYWTLLVGEGWFGGSWIAAGIKRAFPRVNLIANRIIATVLVALMVSATIILIQLAIRQPMSYLLLADAVWAGAGDKCWGCSRELARRSRFRGSAARRSNACGAE